MFTSKKTARWIWLAAMALLAVVGLAACDTAAPTTEAPPPPPTNTALPPEPTATSLSPTPTTAPTPEPTEGPAEPATVQDFEADAQPYEVYQATASISADVVLNGAGALKSESAEGEWHTIGAFLANAPVDFSKHDKMCFWVYDTTALNNGRAQNTVGVRLFDVTGANTERWTDNEGVGYNSKTKTNAWVPMCLNLVTFTGIDLTQIEKIEFALFHPGVYYFDDISLQPIDAKFETVEEAPAAEAVTVLAQGFEAEGTYYADYQVTPTLGITVVHSGESSLRAYYPTGEWHAFGAYLEPTPFDASGFDKVCFWFYDTTANNDGKADNTVGVKLFDSSGANQEVWTDHEGAGENPKSVKGEWVQMCVNLEKYDAIDLTQLEKIQFALFWAGTYFVDDVEFTGSGAVAAPAVVLAQGFEAEGTYYADYQVTPTLGITVVHSGESSLRAYYPTGEWHAFGAYLEPTPFDASAFDKVCFWFYDTTANNNGLADNTVGVKLFDTSGANQEVWTDHEGAGENPKSVKDEWVQMCVNLEKYDAIDLTQLEKIQFALFWAGTYFVDDVEFTGGSGVAVAPEAAPEVPLAATLAQGFEAEGTYYADWQVTPTLGITVVHSGESSLRAYYPTGEWHAFGAFLDPKPFDASAAKKVCFWIYDTTANNNGLADNTVGVKLFDTAGANQEVWTDAEASNTKTVQNEWVQMCIGLDKYNAIDLSQLDKIQFALYWAGTYFIDDIEFYSPLILANAPWLAQGFEAEGTYYADWQVTPTLGITVVHSGESSLRAYYPSGEWHAFGAFLDPKPFDSRIYSKVCFWMYDTTANNNGLADNTVGVKLFDAAGANQEVWTDAEASNTKTVQNEWVQMCIGLDKYNAIDLSQLDKIQFALYWAGTYFIDDIEFVP